MLGGTFKFSELCEQAEGALTPAEAWAARSPMPLMQWEGLVREFQH